MKSHLLSSDNTLKTLCGLSTSAQNITDNVNHADICKTCKKIYEKRSIENAMDSLGLTEDDIVDTEGVNDPKAIKVKIFHLFFDLYEMDKDEQAKRGAWGQEDMNNQNIFIPDQLTTSPQKVGEIFLHEMAHCIYAVQRCQQMKEEDIVSALAIGFCSTWIDNPEIFKYIGYLLTQKSLFDKEEVISACERSGLEPEKVAEILEKLINDEEEENDNDGNRKSKF